MQDTLITIFGDALRVAMQVGSPVLLTALGAGVVMAIFQGLTQVNEQSLSFVPKLALCVLVLIMGSGWMVDTLQHFSVDLFNRIPELAKGK